MKVYSAYNDDGMTIMIHSDSPEEAAQKVEEIINDIGIEMELDFFLDDIEDSYIDDEKTVEQWLAENNIEFSEEVVLVIDGDDVRIYNIEFTE